MMAELNYQLDWRSAVTLVVFIVTNLIIIFPFHVPVYIPRRILDFGFGVLSTLRIIPPRNKLRILQKPPRYCRLAFPFNFATAPILAILFLLAVSAIGRREIHDGTIGTADVSPGDLVLFLLTLAYVSNSIDASGLIRFLSIKVLHYSGRIGHRLYFYIYATSFALGGFIGNDPIIEFGMSVVAYITRMSSNIMVPRAWIYMQFAVVNIASTILVSSNACNVMIANVFNIKFFTYSANMVVPVIITGIVIFPFLLYVIFADESFIPLSIAIHELSEERRARKPVNPNIPKAARPIIDEEEREITEGEGIQITLEDLMNPFLDKGGAFIGLVILIATVVALFALSASSEAGNDPPLFWVTLPAAFVMFCWDTAFGWYWRHNTREIARAGRQQMQRALAERVVNLQLESEALEQQAAHERAPLSESNEQDLKIDIAARKEGMIERDPGTKLEVEPKGPGQNDAKQQKLAGECLPRSKPEQMGSTSALLHRENNRTKNKIENNIENDIENANRGSLSVDDTKRPQYPLPTTKRPYMTSNQGLTAVTPDGLWIIQVEPGLNKSQDSHSPTTTSSIPDRKQANYKSKYEESSGFADRVAREIYLQQDLGPNTLADLYKWLQETFPTTTAAFCHLPFKLVPFVFSIFIMVQALSANGWVAVFTHGWDLYSSRSGTVGTVFGMGLCSVVLCNFAGTNFGATLLLANILKQWKETHDQNQDPVSDRTFWATVYTLAIGVNFGAFSTVFNASVTGLQWRENLARKGIRIGKIEFARVNLPIISMAMVIGCVVMVGQVYIMRH